MWRSIKARLRLFFGIIAGVAVAPLLPASLSATTRGVLAWDVGVVVYLILAAHLFATEPIERMPAHAEAQQRRRMV